MPGLDPGIHVRPTERTTTWMAGSSPAMTMDEVCPCQRIPLISRPARDRPQRLDAVAAIADIPVIEIDRRIAMAGDEADLVADDERPVGLPELETAVLVGGGGVFDVAEIGEGRHS